MDFLHPLTSCCSRIIKGFSSPLCCVRGLAISLGKWEDWSYHKGIERASSPSANRSFSHLLAVPSCCFGYSMRAYYNAREGKGFNCQYIHLLQMYRGWGTILNFALGINMLWVICWDISYIFFHAWQALGSHLSFILCFRLSFWFSLSTSSSALLLGLAWTKPREVVCPQLLAHSKPLCWSGQTASLTLMSQGSYTVHNSF